MSLIGVESMVPRAGLRYTRAYLTPGICSQIKPTAMEQGKSEAFDSWVKIDDFFSRVTLQLDVWPWKQ